MSYLFFNMNNQNSNSQQLVSLKIIFQTKSCGVLVLVNLKLCWTALFKLVIQPKYRLSV